MAHYNNAASACKHLFKGGHSATDAGIVGDVEIFIQGDIEVYAYNGLFSGKVVTVYVLSHNMILF
jgi:hypothetical protein